MPATTKSLIVRELQWLLGILVAAVPLTMVLYSLTRQTPELCESLDKVLGYRAGNVGIALYVLVVLSCYLGRLGAFGAARLAQRIPQEAGPPRSA